ncbi:minor tail protein [Microbacterium phage IAmGroot]|uniref:Minor tail protein n=1 Tax=Microbacterium phage IAmGroot TaxID=2588486 RepID=A0A4Y6EHX5_9CAUD|nr:minor tail protein [Microbacterium phage IAmGroot]
MPTYTDAFSGRPQFSLRLIVSPRAYSQAGNYTDVEISLAVVETTSSPSYVLDSMPWAVTVAGQTWNGASPLDFRASGLQTITLMGTTVKRITHDSNGYATISFSASMSAGGTFGSAAISTRSLTLTRIPKPPAAPSISGTVGGTLLGPQDIKTTSMVVKFSANSNNGAAVDQWQLQYANNASFSGATTITSSGTSTITGLMPGTTYYFRARGHNVAGWGPYSATASATTLTAVYVSDGSTWHSADVFVSDGTKWHNPEVWVSNGSAWLQPLA